MASTLTNLLYHAVFSTKERRNIIQTEIKEDLYSYVGGIIRGEKGVLLTINATADHMHLLAKFHPSISVSEMLKHIKGSSSKWVNDDGRTPHHFAWQRGYGAFSVSQSAVQAVSAYINGQEAHHKQMTFKEEFLALLKKHEVEYDERYIWD